MKRQDIVNSMSALFEERREDLLKENDAPVVDESESEDEDEA